MTAEDFRAWLERRGLNYSQAAPLLAADHTEVGRWAKGERKVPRRVVRIVELLSAFPLHPSCPLGLSLLQCEVARERGSIVAPTCQFCFFSRGEEDGPHAHA